MARITMHGRIGNGLFGQWIRTICGKRNWAMVREEDFVSLKDTRGMTKAHCKPTAHIYIIVYYPHGCIIVANELIQDDPRNNSAWNQRWFASHQGRQSPISLESARHEADFAIHTGATLDPFNESPWRYLIGVLKEQWKVDPDPELIDEYEEKAAGLRTILSDAKRDPDTCANLTSARIDLFELKGDKESLEKVGLKRNWLRFSIHGI
jgi:hypothetical protein